jgi:hypothetical protein
VHDQFNGDIELTRKTVTAAVARERAAATAVALGEQRIEELRQWANDRSLDKNAHVRDVIDRYAEALKRAASDDDRRKVRDIAITDLRSVVMGIRAEQQLSVEFQDRPGRRVRRDIQVWRAQDPRFKSVAEFKAANIEMFKKSDRGVTMIDGRAYLEITDLDFVVTAPGAKGDHVIHVEELKTGRNDTPSKADQQITDGRRAIADSVAGKAPVRLLEGGKDVTAEFDLSSFATASKRTHGPEKPENKFEKSLGVDAKALERLINQLLDDWHPPTSPKGAS